MNATIRTHFLINQLYSTQNIANVLFLTQLPETAIYSVTNCMPIVFISNNQNVLIKLFILIFSVHYFGIAGGSLLGSLLLFIACMIGMCGCSKPNPKPTVQNIAGVGLFGGKMIG